MFNTHVSPVAQQGHTKYIGHREAGGDEECPVGCDLQLHHKMPVNPTHGRFKILNNSIFLFL